MAICHSGYNERKERSYACCLKMKSTECGRGGVFAGSGSLEPLQLSAKEIGFESEPSDARHTTRIALMVRPVGTGVNNLASHLSDFDETRWETGSAEKRLGPNSIRCDQVMSAREPANFRTRQPRYPVQTLHQLTNFARGELDDSPSVLELGFFPMAPYTPRTVSPPHRCCRID